MGKNYEPDYLAEVTEELITYVFEDQHRYIEHDDHAEIICPDADDIFYVRSESGKRNYFCPGCGNFLELK